MRRSRVWLVIPIYWVLFIIYSMFLVPIRRCFPYGDFIVGSGEYHYGACSFSVTVSFVLLILGLLYVGMRGRKQKNLERNKKKIGIVMGALILSFVMQFFFYLSYFGIFFLFGIVVW